MNLRAPILASNPSPEAGQADRIKHWPAEARLSFQKFQTQGDPDGIDPAIHAILADFVPGTHQAALATSTGSTRLQEDLGFDSLAIAELVFFTEDLFGIRIGNEEILHVRTVDDLREFIHRKLAVSPIG